MHPASTLLSLCAVAVSIAGFAGIAFAFGSRGSTEDDLAFLRIIFFSSASEP